MARSPRLSTFEVQHATAYKGREWLVTVCQLCHSLTWRCSPERSPPIPLLQPRIDQAHLHISIVRKSMHPSALCSRATTLVLCLQQSHWLLHRPKLCVTISGIPQSVWYVTVFYWSLVTVNWVCIMIRTHSEDMECKNSVRAVTNFIYRLW